MVAMYFKEPTEDFAWVKLSPAVVIAIVVSVIGVFYLGIIPGSVMAMAKLALF